MSHASRSSRDRSVCNILVQVRRLIWCLAGFHESSDNSLVILIILMVLVGVFWWLVVALTIFLKYFQIFFEICPFFWKWEFCPSPSTSGGYFRPPSTTSGEESGVDILALHPKNFWTTNAATSNQQQWCCCPSSLRNKASSQRLTEWAASQNMEGPTIPKDAVHWEHKKFIQWFVAGGHPGWSLQNGYRPGRLPLLVQNLNI